MKKAIEITTFSGPLPMTLVYQSRLCTDSIGCYAGCGMAYLG